MPITIVRKDALDAAPETESAAPITIVSRTPLEAERMPLASMLVPGRQSTGRPGAGFQAGDTMGDLAGQSVGQLPRTDYYTRVTAPDPATHPPGQEEERRFQSWYADRAKALDLNPNPDAPDQMYDYRAAFRNKAEPGPDGHWPSQFKKAGHPNEIVGGFNTRTGERVPGTARASESELVRMGWDAEAAKRLAAMPEPKRTMGDLARKAESIADAVTLGPLRRDIATTVLKGAIGVPEALVGLGDIVTGGRLGKALENRGGAIGFDPQQAKAYLDTWYSERQKGAFKEVEDADGVLYTAIAALSNPSVIAHSVLESAPSMLLGGGVGRAAGLAGRAASAAGAIGEGMVTAGQAAEGTRQESPDRLLDPRGAALAVTAGATTGGLGLLGGKLAAKLGIEDVDTLLAAGVADKVAERGLAKQIVLGSIQEGLLEELPQSVSEQIQQNLATGRDPMAGVDKAAVLGALAGAVMGGGAQLAGRHGAGPEAVPPAGGEPLAPEMPSAPPEDLAGEATITPGPVAGPPVAEPVAPTPAAPTLPQEMVQQLEAVGYEPAAISAMTLVDAQEALRSGQQPEAPPAPGLGDAAVAEPMAPENILAAGTEYATNPALRASVAEMRGATRAEDPRVVDQAAPELAEDVTAEPLPGMAADEAAPIGDEPVNTETPAAGPGSLEFTFTYSDGGTADVTYDVEERADGSFTVTRVETANDTGHRSVMHLDDNYEWAKGRAARTVVSGGGFSQSGHALGFPTAESAREAIVHNAKELRETPRGQDAPVDTAQPQEDTVSRDASGAEDADREGPAGDARVDGDPPRVPTEEPYRNVERAPRYFQALRAAQRLDPDVDEKVFRAEFETRHDVYDEIHSAEAEREADPRELLKEIARMGGIFEQDNGKGQAGEMRRLREGQAFGRVGGVAGVMASKPRRMVNKAERDDVTGEVNVRQVRAGGLPLDVILQDLQADGRWPWLESIDDLTDFLDDIQKQGVPGGAKDETALLKAMGLDPATKWWEDNRWTSDDDGFDDDFDVDTLEAPAEDTPQPLTAASLRDTMGLTKPQAAATFAIADAILDELMPRVQIVKGGTPGRRALPQAGSGLDLAPAAYVNGGRALLSTRVPTAVKAQSPDGVLFTDLAVVRQNKKLTERMAAPFRRMSVLTRKEAAVINPSKVLDSFVATAKGNLRFLFDQMPAEHSNRARKWYDGAHRIAGELADQYGISHAQASGVLAALSPQMDWFRNVGLAERTISIATKAGTENPTFEGKPLDWYRGYLAGKLKALPPAALASKRRDNEKDLASLVGKRWKDLDLSGKAVFVRAIDEANNPRSYDLIAPEGDRVGKVVNADGVTESKIGWGTFQFIANAVSILEDGHIENIHLRIGGEHKVRSFFNNISDPSDAGSVTIDTHAVAAALLRPLSGAAGEVTDALGGRVKDLTAGISGTNAAYAQAYNELARELTKETGETWLPREVQSVTWEAVRGLFEAKQKTGPLVGTTELLWKDYQRGKLSAHDLRTQVLAAAGGIKPPSWTATSARPAAVQGKRGARPVSPGRADVAARPGDTGRGAGRSAGRIAVQSDGIVRGRVADALYQRASGGPSLFDDEDTVIDQTAAGAQPRLPGDVGAVRDEERPTPKLSEIEDEFRLTPQYDKRKGHQTTLFQMKDGGDLPLYQPAWHGSPHIFDEFKLHAIGTGEGAQAYGWGLYFAGDKSVAKYYRDTLAGRSVVSFTALNDEENNALFPGFREQTQLAMKNRQMSTLADIAGNTVRDLDERISEAKSDGDRQQEARLSFIRAAYQKAVDSGFKNDYAPGRLYKVDIPEHEDYLDWDKPLSEQNEKVREAMSELVEEERAYKERYPGGGLGERRGSNLYSEMERRLGSPKAVSEWLADAGVPGIRYLDGNSRSKGWKDVRKAVFAELPDNADADEVMEGIESYKPEHAALLRGLAADDWLGFDYPSQAISAALDPASSGNFDMSPALKKAVATLMDAAQGSHNYVVFDDKLVKIMEFEQGTPDGAKASVEFTQSGDALIRALNNPDASSGVHEIAHVARRWLLGRDILPERRRGITDEDIETAEKWSGAKNGVWSEQAEEKFARGFERYLRDGQAPTMSKPMRRIFSKFASWLSDVYTALKGSPIDLKISPEMRKVYDALITRKERNAKADAVAAAPVETPKVEASRNVVSATSVEGGRVVRKDVSATAEDDRFAAKADAEARKIIAAAQPTSDGFLDRIEQEAKDRIKKRGTTDVLYQNNDPAKLPLDDVEDLKTIGAAKVARGFTDRKAFEKEMLREFGDSVAPVMGEVFTEATKRAALASELDIDDYFNFKRISVSDDERASLRGIITETILRTGRVPKEKTTFDQIRTEAKDMGLDEIAQLKPFMESQAPFRAVRDAARRRINVLNQEIVQARKALEGVPEEETLERERAIEAKEQDVRSLLDTWMRMRSEDGRNLAMHRMMVDSLETWYDATFWASRAKREMGLPHGVQLPVVVFRQLQDILNRGQQAVEMGRAPEPIQLELSKYLASLRRNTLLETIAALRKAGLLTGIKTHMRNIGGNTAFAVLEELSRVPAVVVDFALATATHQRTVHGLSTRAVAASSKEAATKGISDAVEVLKNGQTAGDLARTDHKREHNSGSKVVDAYINYTFRALSAMDRVFRSYAFRRSLEEQAALEAINRGVSPIELLAKPSEAMLTRAIADAEFATFNNQNVIAGLAANARGYLKRQGGAGAVTNFAIDMVVPFINTPSNVVARMFDYTPVGVGKVVTKAAIQKAMGEAMTPEQQRLFAMGIGRGATGSALIYLGWMLAAAGLASGLGGDDPGDRNVRDSAGILNGALKIGGRWHQIASFSPAGNIIALGASLQRTATQPFRKEAMRSAKLIGIGTKLVMEQPMLKGMADLVDALQKPESAGENVISSTVGSFVPTFVNDIASAFDPYRRDARPKGGNSSLWTGAAARLPGLRNMLPARRDVFGRELDQDAVAIWSPTIGAVARDMSDQVLRELVKHDVGIGWQPKKDGETEEQFVERVKVTGDAVRKEITRVVNGPRYSSASDEKKAEMLEDAVQDARRKVRKPSRPAPRPRFQ